MKPYPIIKNKETKFLEQICKAGNCPYSEVFICHDTIQFQKPNTQFALVYMFYQGDWHVCTRTPDPWNGKICQGLRNRYPNSKVDGMNDYDANKYTL